ncbi:nitroreductase family protein [Tepidimicrobium xylanilyticum]|uniref:Nitroreductase n=1 Tax=Tepidimicrobium xylanilyticum TaxID=1123352 RepID=A0A1H2ZB48_9FIRM|nr:nitroreductase family protein [Tepidimicrobium xylanilyticum]GMG96427.1 nitroreductase [Tepidimicrobium xylanilyticum]SDX14198.1 Nitroreductase [Tepidimicrobium xylanilyticum]
MLMGNFLKNRKSVRDFKKKKMDDRTKTEVLEIFKDLEMEVDNKYFNFILFEEGEKIYNVLNGLAGYSGVMIESPCYIGVRLKEVNDKSIITASYYTEKLMTLLTHRNLGTCWVNIKDVDRGVKVKVLGEENKNIGYLVALGYPKAKNPFVQEPTSSRYGVSDIVFKDKIGNSINAGELEKRGLEDLFYYIRFAPSNYNLQPWRFIIKDDKILLLLKYSEEGKTDLMDAGIIMYYFKELGKVIGIKSEWQLLEKEDIECGDSRYRVIAEIKL